MHKLLITAVSILLLLGNGLKASSSIDSILYYNSVIEADTNSVNQQFLILDRAIALSKQKGDVYHLANYEVQKAISYINLNEFGKSAAILERYLPLLKKQIKDTSDKVWIDLYSLALINLMQCDISQSDIPSAIHRVNTILEVCDIRKPSKALLRVYNGYGVIYAMQRKYTKAEEHFKKAWAIGKELKDYKNQVSVLLNFSSVYLSQKKIEEALVTSLEAYKMVNSHKIGGNKLALALSRMANTYLILGQYSMADRYYLMALEEVNKYHNINLEYSISINYAQSLFFAGEKQAIEKSKHILLDLLPKMSKANMKSSQANVAYVLKEIYRKEQNYEKALYYSDIYVTQSGYVYKNEAKEKKEAFDYFKNVQEKKIAEQNLELAKAKLDKRNIGLAFLSLLGILALIAIVFMVRRILHQCKVNELIKSKMLHNDKINSDQTQHLKQQFEDEISTKNKELTVNTLMFAKFTELISSINKKLKELKIASSPDSKSKQIFSEIEDLLKQFSPDQGWSEFETYFKQVDTEFFKNLKGNYPNLTPNENRLCALIHLNMSTKEIASLTHRTFQSINIAKFRLKKKMGLESDQSLYEALSIL
ncbi:MAG: tetratricopeptide repeat protein [Bacteroidales bacterium]